MYKNENMKKLKSPLISSDSGLHRIRNCILWQTVPEWDFLTFRTVTPELVFRRSVCLSGCYSHKWKLEKSDLFSNTIEPNCFEKQDWFLFNNTAAVNTSFYLMSFRYCNWSHTVMSYFSFSFAKEPQRWASPKIATLSLISLALKLKKLWTHERSFDEYPIRKEMHVKSRLNVVLFWQNSHENVFWKVNLQPWLKLWHEA